MGCTAWHSTPPSPSGAKKAASHNELYQLIDLLPKADRALIYLYIDGVSETEMASILGISPSSVGVRIHRIKQKLRDLRNKSWKTS